MHSTKIIGITGKAGAGKDTLAQFFIDQGYKQLSFAAPLKTALNAMFGWTPEQWDDRDWKEALLPDIGKSPRQLAQTLGSEWGRGMVHEGLWLMLAAKAIADSDAPVVISDVRYDNEAVLLKSLGGEVLHVVRPQTFKVSAHRSELGISPSLIDWQVLNDGSIEELHRKVARLFPVASAMQPSDDLDLPNQRYGGMTMRQVGDMVEEWMWATVVDRKLIADRYKLDYATMSNYIQSYKQEVRNGRTHYPTR